MLEVLIKCFRENRMKDAESILKKNPIYKLLPKPQKFKRKHKQQQELNRIKSIEHELINAIGTHVHSPKTIHALLVAGFSPIQLGILFYSDNRFEILLNLLPLLNVESINEQELEDSVNNSTNARRHDVREIFYRGTPYFPIEYQGNTFDFEIVIGCLKKGIKLSSEAENKPENIEFIPCLYEYLKKKEQPNQKRSSSTNLNNSDLLFLTSALGLLIALQLFRIFYFQTDKKAIDDSAIILFVYTMLYITYQSFNDEKRFNYKEKANNLLVDIYKRHHKNPNCKDMLFWKKIFDEKKYQTPGIESKRNTRSRSTERFIPT